ASRANAEQIAWAGRVRQSAFAYSRFVLLIAVALVLTLTLTLLSAGSGNRPAVSTTMVISQIYGGGGNSGSTYKNDFIELYNLSNATVDVSAWSVQYASATSGTWQVTPLTGSIAPGHYYLVQEAAGSGGTTNL